MFQRHHRCPDPRLREALVERYLPLARHVANRFDGGGRPREDLFQVACIALVKAVDRFDPDRGVAFSSYAVPTMVGALKRHLRFGYEEPRFARVEQGADLWSLVGALGTQERAVLRLRFELDMTQPEIARALGVSQAHVSRMLRRALEHLRTLQAADAA
jgi:RNA polymerase sigma-B factor